jgi:hypothetical protein
MNQIHYGTSSPFNQLLTAVQRAIADTFISLRQLIRLSAEHGWPQ